MPHTYPLLEKAPKHTTPEFIDYLRSNNPVIFEDTHWLIIENCKYHKPDEPWLTAFFKSMDYPWAELKTIYELYPDWEWLKKPKVNQTVRRFHIHLIKK